MKCVVCGENRFNKLFQKASYGRKFDFIRCNNCSFVTIDPYPTKKELNEFYSREYDFSYMVMNSKRVKKLNKNRIEILMEFLKKGTLLDIGCGSGLFLSQAKKYFRVTGLEQSNIAEYGVRKFGLNIIRKDIENIPKDKQYDAITLFHVFEHIREPNEFLKNIKKLMKKESVLYMIMPNINSMSFKLFGRGWGWLNPPKHLSYFNVPTLKRILTKNGFEVEYTKTQRGDDYNPIFGIAFAMLYYTGLKDKMEKDMFSKGKASSSTGLYEAVFAITNIISLIFWPFEKLFEKFGWGSEIAIVAKKRNDA